MLFVPCLTLFIDLEKNINSNKEAKNASNKKNLPESDNPLDAMLNDMINDSSEVTPTSKGTCPTCGRPVMGEAVAALGKVWHRGRFFADPSVIDLFPEKSNKTQLLRALCVYY